MRHGAAGRRSRNRGHGNQGHNSHQGRQHYNGRGGGNNRMQVFDSNGPEVRIRGTAHQICEKYLALAKDAAAQGNRVLSESYLQHAEHYQRIINSWAAEARDDRSPVPAASAQPEEGQPNEPPVSDLSLPASLVAPVAVRPVAEMADA